MEEEKQVSEVNKRQVGQFKISMDLVRGAFGEVGLWAFMEKVFVVRCEYMYSDGCFHYTALSPYFDETTEGEIPPEYKAILTEQEDESVTVKWERI
ncbi:hypothetical protein KAR91_88450 [Candidatus Pacearchaeota archaeon]|nr:hypothetical protein [Candidatus Pacearchaeota archaeon]